MRLDDVNQPGNLAEAGQQKPSRSS
jgi:hypothetical protein